MQAKLDVLKPASFYIQVSSDLSLPRPRQTQLPVSHDSCAGIDHLGDKHASGGFYATRSTLSAFST